MIDNRTVGKTIAALRQARGMTQQQLAAAMNVSHQAVSKWENGAALPDIQTLMELTQLFGITVEQLLSGEIPEPRLESDSGVSLKNIGQFIDGMINDIGNVFKSEPKDAPEAVDGAVDAQVVGENAGEEPAAEPSPEGGEDAAEADGIDLAKLLQMAPFMSKGAVEDMLRSCKRKLTAAEIAKFAPFVDSAFLESLIVDNEAEINWDTLRRIAPFLKKEAVDAFARAIAMGEKYVRPAADSAKSAASSVYKSLDDVSQKIGRGVDKAVRKVVRISENVASEVSRAFDGLSADAETAEQRLARLRRSAFERAIEDGQWDWISAHIGEVQDADLKRTIAERANALGKQDWVRANLGGYASDRVIAEAVEEGNWGWLGEHIWEFSAEMQRQVALAAMKAENWQWLAAHAEQMDMRDCVVEIAACARRAGARMLAVQLARYDMEPAQVEHVALDAAGAKDYEFIEMILDLLPGESLCRLCIRMAKAGEWDEAYKFAEKLDAKGLEWLMEVAIDAGNFAAIDRLDEQIRSRQKEDEQK